MIPFVTFIAIDHDHVRHSFLAFGAFNVIAVEGAAVNDVREETREES